MHDVQSAWVYILLCADGKYYVGSHRGPDPEVRVSAHNQGLDPKAFTFKRRPVKLVWASDFQFITDAIACERQIKGWTRAKKEALMRGDWAGLQRLAQSKTPRPSMRFEDNLKVELGSETSKV
ncbi:MAG: excinuclease subunit-like protein [Caulobacter sp.]|nr:excinuclease subunit-like protein [Caulobacter sp.]